VLERLGEQKFLEKDLFKKFDNLSTSTDLKKEKKRASKGK